MGKKKADRRLADNEAMARAKMIRVSPQKLNLVAASIRGKSASAAVAELTFSKRRVAKDVKAILESAIANAENNHQLDVDNLFVAEASVGRAMVMKRWRPRARGRVGKIMKPWSNMRIILREREETA
ncbi:50S ribosomal protein L22 [Terasakiella pusilla]|jgi:large subunit ribosomal protein L22|uniref:50S ribosomal protein L22 n=1 Tax=Terasakiella pusilla TaxID=64973 RepID=UPI00056DAFEE|nr:50S ribosomal protein L22 [Terasakiella pusilla]